MAKQAEPFTQVNVSLPAGLLAFIQRQAALKDHTLSGAIRHLVAEAERLEAPPPPPKSSFPVLPNVQGNAKSIAEARGRIEEYQRERAQIEGQRRRLNGSAADDARDQQLLGFIHVTEGRIKIAQRQVRSPANGGSSNAV